MPKISGRNIANNNSPQRGPGNANQNAQKFSDYESGLQGSINKRKKNKEAPNPIDEDIFDNAKQNAYNSLRVAQDIREQASKNNNKSQQQQILESMRPI